ncbi:MAG: AI-2E family transporter [Canibacter sp.]
MTQQPTDEGKPQSSSASEVHDAAGELPLGIRVAAAWSWRLILLGVATAAAIWLIVQIRMIVIPLLVAILFAALLHPVVDWLKRRGIPKAIGVIISIFLLLGVVTLLVWLIVTQFRSGIDAVVIRSQSLWQDVLQLVRSQPFGLDTEQINAAYEQLLASIERNQSRLWSGALGVATSTAQFLGGSLLALFALVFMLIDGRRIWYWVLGFLPANAHAPVDAAATAGWASVGQYVRVQIFVAFVDAIGIGLGAWILGVPLAVPIAVLVFLGSFIPFLGAISTGILACFVALLYNGPLNALIMLIIVIIVNQVEGHILQPLVMGSAVRVHPLGVVVAVTGGALIAGIPGALFAVPIAASANSMVNTLVKGNWKGAPDPLIEYHATHDKRNEVKMRLKHIAKLARRKGNR